MRRFSHGGAAVAAVGALYCVTPLDHEFDVEPPDTSAAGDASPLPGCRPLADRAAAGTLAGDLRSIAEADGGSLWLVDQVTAPDGGLTLGATFQLSPGARPDCSGWAPSHVAPAFDPSPLDPGGLLVAQDLVQTASGLAAYYALFASDPSKPLGIRLLGYGLAPQDAASGRFTPTGDLLWSGDRPGYGSSALAVGGTIYVHGCKSNAPLTDDCYVARADPTHLSSSSGYAYWAGDHWSLNPDDATPVAQAGGAVSVRPDPTGKPRFIMTYVPPFGSALVARSAVSPEGPWSAPVAVTGCALDPSVPGAFCGGGQQHPELAGTNGRLALSYAARTFASDAGDNPQGFWPQLVAVDVPAELP